MMESQPSPAAADEAPPAGEEEAEGFGSGEQGGSGGAAAAEPAAEPGDGGGDGEDVAALPPDHPLLQRAQEALFQQLQATKLRLQEELRERRQALKARSITCSGAGPQSSLWRQHAEPLFAPPPLCTQDAKAAREAAGVELYGFQQHLARLQLSLERSAERCAEVAAERGAAEAAARQAARQAADEAAATAEQAKRVEELQRELERLAETLRAVERYSSEAAAELAVTKRTAAATEGAVQRLERAKQEQDFLIDGLQQQLGRLGRELELHGAQLEAQRRETRAAQASCSCGMLRRAEQKHFCAPTHPGS